MKTAFYLDGKKTTRKAMKELYGEADLKKYIESAKEGFGEDPYTEESFWTGQGMLTIEFNI